MKEELLALLREIQPYEDIEYETELFEEGILDSVDFAEFIAAVEDRFGVVIPEEKIRSKNFSTVLVVERLLKSL